MGGSYSFLSTSAPDHQTRLPKSPQCGTLMYRCSGLPIPPTTPEAPTGRRRTLPSPAAAFAPSPARAGFPVYPHDTYRAHPNTRRTGTARRLLPAPGDHCTAGVDEMVIRRRATSRWSARIPHVCHRRRQRASALLLQGRQNPADRLGIFEHAPMVAALHRDDPASPGSQERYFDLAQASYLLVRGSVHIDHAAQVGA